MTDLAGKTLSNRYFLRELAGSGGMADVYQAWDTMRSARLAVKVLRRDLANSPRFFQMFAKEAELLRKLEHPSIVRLYELDRDLNGDITFIIMDWVDGTDLKTAIVERKRVFSLDEISNILQAVCSALFYAHQNHIFHCDVKPANILLNKDQQALLTDFGVARLATENAGGGTAQYMAPEQFLGGRVDARTDVYALGVTLYEIMSGGQVPYRGKTSSSQGSSKRERIAWEHINMPLPSLGQHNPQISPAVENVVNTALSKEPTQRYTSTMKLREAFEHARLQGGRGRGTASTKLRPEPVAPKPLQKQSRAPEPAQPRRPLKPRWKSSHAPQILGRSGEREGQAIPITAQALYIGRSSRNNLQLKERSVSRVHTLIWVTTQGTYIRDENSSLGTFVNGLAITAPTLLRHGDVIRIGYYQEFEYQE
ncbi:MAG: protein kinase [Anaerolineales bacterium]|nr:protein kinase [Anaerolineales bacterium]